MPAECEIHPSAIVEPGSSLGTGVRIGPFCHVGPDVVIGDHVQLKSHVVVGGATEIGARTAVYPFACLGGAPQSVKHTGGPTSLIIGRDCTIREGVVMHVGTDTGRGRTTIGDHGMFLAYCQVAHDCDIGDHVTMAGYSGLAGHCEVADHVTISGNCGVHQFVRIGRHAYVGGMTGLRGDLIPFGMAVGSEPRGNLRGLNVVGLKRSGISHSDLQTLRKAYLTLFDRQNTVAENARRVLETFSHSTYAVDLATFIAERKNRHFCVPPRSSAPGEIPDARF